MFLVVLTKNYRMISFKGSQKYPANSKSTDYIPAMFQIGHTMMFDHTPSGGKLYTMV